MNLDSAMAARRVQFSSCDLCRKQRLSCDARRYAASYHVPSPTARIPSIDTILTGQAVTEAGLAMAMSHWQRPAEDAGTRARAALSRSIQSMTSPRLIGADILRQWLKGVKPRASARARYARTRRHESVPEAPKSPWRDDTGSLTDDHQPSSVDGPLESSVQHDGFDEGSHPLTQSMTLRSEMSADALDSLSDTDSLWLDTIYTKAWETVFGSWLGAHSCPFLYLQPQVNCGSSADKSQVSPAGDSRDRHQCARLLLTIGCLDQREQRRYDSGGQLRRQSRRAPSPGCTVFRCAVATAHVLSCR